MKNNKKQNLFKYIKDTTGLSVSKMLLSFIIEPNRITTLNNVALKKIVIEYAPSLKNIDICLMAFLS